MTYDEMNKREAEYMSKHGYGIRYDIDIISGMTITQKIVQREEKQGGGYRNWNDEVTAADLERVRKHHKFDMK